MSEDWSQIKSVYERLKAASKTRLHHEETLELIRTLFRLTSSFLNRQSQIALQSSVPNKDYFAFGDEETFSRAINRDLYVSDEGEVELFFATIQDSSYLTFDKTRFTRCCYTVAISFCAVVDLLKKRDQKTPGTFFEYLIGHLVSRFTGIQPTKQLNVMNLDELNAKLPTDFIFNLGKNKPKFHLPIKTSTRERIIQVWAHQRVLDGAFGTGCFLGIPVILAETKTDKTKRVVTEICVPDQWRIFQMNIARIESFYFLDLPNAYRDLNGVFPSIKVAPFGAIIGDIRAVIEKYGSS